MNNRRRSTKVYLRNEPPNKVLKLLDDYNIASPYKEILIVSCVKQLKAFPAIDYLEEHFNIYISYWNYIKLLPKALDMFYKAHVLK